MVRAEDRFIAKEQELQTTNGLLSEAERARERLHSQLEAAKS